MTTAPKGRTHLVERAVEAMGGMEARDLRPSPSPSRPSPPPPRQPPRRLSRRHPPRRRGRRPPLPRRPSRST